MNVLAGLLIYCIFLNFGMHFIFYTYLVNDGCSAQPRKDGTPSTARCSPSPEPVAVYVQSLYYPPRHNAGIHNMSVVVCNLYCARNSDRQVSSGRNLRRFRQINTNHDIYTTQSLIMNPVNMSVNKISVLTKYWRRQNIGVDKI
jgi:hypothetical protein